LPVLLDLVESTESGGLVDRDDHSLTREASAEEMLHNVAGYSLQPVVACDQLVLLPEQASQLAFLLLIEVRLLDQVGEILAEVWIYQLEGGDPVFEVQGHRRTVSGGRCVVVDRDVVAEDFLRPLLAGDKWSAGEAQETCIRKRVAHVERQSVVLGSVSF